MKSYRLRFALLVCMAAAPGLHAANITLNVNVDTSSINGVTGNLTFQIEPPPNIIIDLNNFATDGTLVSNTETNGVTGALPGQVVLNGVAAVDEVRYYSQRMTFGDYFRLAITFDFSASTEPPNGQWLFFTIQDRVNNHTNYPFGLETAHFDGYDLQNIYVLADPVVTVSAAGAGAPEPSTWMTLASGLGLLLTGSVRGRVLKQWSRRQRTNS